MRSVYSSDNIRRSVIKGLLIGSTLLGAVFSAGLSTALAATQDNAYLGDIQNYPSTEIVAQDRAEYAAEFAIISKIKMSNNMLAAAIKTDQISALVYDKLMQSLATLNAKIMLDGSFTKVDDLLPILKQTGVLLETNLSLSPDLVAKRDSAISALHASQLKVRGDQILIFIDGVQQNYHQKAVIKDGTTLVPMRGVFDSLGAIIDWNEVTRTVTATKGDIVVKLTLGQSTAYVNGAPVKLAVPAEAPMGSTMVPLRFVGEALGNKVEWDAVNRSVLIESGKATNPNSGVTNPTPTPVVTAPAGMHKSTRAPYTEAGLNIVYGNHTYGNKTQSEYDQSLDIVKKEVDSVKASVKGVSDLPSGWVRYFNGERAQVRDTNAGQNDRDLIHAEAAIGQLVVNGVTMDQLVTIYQSRVVYTNLLDSYKPTDPKDGTPSSAYDFVARGVSDCDSDSQTSLLVYDLLGIEGSVIGAVNHADSYIKVGSTWYLTGTATGGTFIEVNMDKLPSSKPVVAQPVNYTITPGVGVVAK